MSVRVHGWCPGTMRPMMSGDGLIVRLRPQYGEVTPDQMSVIAEVASEFGSGAIEVTSRASLQIRGVREDAYSKLIKQLDQAGLVRTLNGSDVPGNLITSPYLGWDDETSKTIADLLESGLAAKSSLPSKFGFIIDAGETRFCENVSADIRIERGDDGLIVRADGQRMGGAVGSVTDAANKALAIADWFIDSGGIGDDGRGRLRQHLLNCRLPDTLAGNARPVAATQPHPGSFAGSFSVAAAFGQFSATQLKKLARANSYVIRLSPHRSFVFRQPFDIDDEDLIDEASDPKQRVYACVGSPGCAQAEGETRDLASKLATNVAAGHSLHVSGCEKRCAHPGATTHTVIAQGSGYTYSRTTDSAKEIVLVAKGPEQLSTLINESVDAL